MVQCILKKMTVYAEVPIRYSLSDIEGNSFSLSGAIGKNITITSLNKITCQGCGKTTKKSFAQGYCYSCFLTHPDTEECILKPELCKAQFGIARDMQIASQNHLAPHYVYLSFTSGLKVGVTRETQIPVRWIDQGALQAAKLLKVPNRHIAGVAEVYLKQFYKDKTAWQKMISTNEVNINLLHEKEIALNHLPSELQQYNVTDNKITTLTYPDGEINPPLKSVNLDNENEITGKLTGIKGQYLIIDNKKVFNMRKHTGYHTTIKTN